MLSRSLHSPSQLLVCDGKGTTFFARFQANRHYAVSQNYAFIILLANVSSFLSSLKETKQRKVQKRPELRGRNTNSSNHSMNSLRSNSISYFVAQIASRNQRLNIDSKNLHSSKDLFVRNVFEELRLDERYTNTHRASLRSKTFRTKRHL
jgi:hypothetical protein